MRNKKIVLVIFIAAVLAGYLGYNYIYQDHRDIQSEEAAYTVKATDLVKAFQYNEEDATKKYLNKTIAIEGNLSSIDGTSIVLENVVFFALSENATPPTSDVLNTTIKIKGRCIGYDNLLEEVKVDQAAILD